MLAPNTGLIESDDKITWLETTHKQLVHPTAKSSHCVKFIDSTTTPIIGRLVGQGLGFTLSETVIDTRYLKDFTEQVSNAALLSTAT